MLQILKRKDADGYLHILERFGLSAYDTDISESVEDGTVNGYAVYRLSPEGIFFYDVKANDLTIYDGIVRSVLFLAALKGVERARFLLDDKSNVISLGFVSLETDVLDPISGVLGGCSGCGNNN